MSIVLLCALLFSQAIAHYEQAGDYYRGEESTRWLFAVKNICIASLLLCDVWSFLFFLKIYTETSFHFSLFSSANKCLLKVATYAAQLEQYQKAVEIYEQVGYCLQATCYQSLYMWYDILFSKHNTDIIICKKHPRSIWKNLDIYFVSFQCNILKAKVEKNPTDFKYFCGMVCFFKTNKQNI